MNILVAGYPETDRVELESRLATHGYTLLITEDLGQLVESIKANNPKILVIPAVRDKFNGFKFTRAIRKVMPVKVVLTVDTDHSSQKNYAMAQGASAAIQEGLLINDLPNVVANMADPKAQKSGAGFTPGSSVSSSRFDAADISTITESLSEYVGPIANLLVQRAMGSARDIKSLYAVVSAQIEDEDDKAQFLALID